MIRRHTRCVNLRRGIARAWRVAFTPQGRVEAIIS